MKEIDIGFYLILVGASFTLGGILGGLIVYSVSKFFREMSEELDAKELGDRIDES